MAAISVVICCANVADTIEAACRSSLWADELIVVDSGSTDQTAAIAQRYASRYVLEPWRGYTGQKSFGASLAKNDWVFVLDGDEEISPALAAELQHLSESELDRSDVMLVRRRTYVMGRLVRAWWPDWQSRLIHRQRTRWADELFHDDRLPSHRSRIRRLRGAMEHRRTSEAGFGDFFNGRQLDDRLQLIARQMYQQGRRCRWSDVLFRPMHAFIKFYFLKMGFLDGMFGYMIAQRMATSAHLKYAALWALEQQQKAKQSTTKGDGDNQADKPAQAGSTIG